MEEFIDSDHTVSETFDLLIDIELKDTTWMIKKLEALIREDPNYFDPYVYLHNLYLEHKNYIECEKIILQGFKRALKLILNNDKQWPARLKWTFIENRHIIRLLETVGIWFWRKKECEKALKLFRKLLKSNPEDNIGARYYILALRMHVDYDNFNECLDRGGFFDSEIDEWFNKDYKKFPDEFEWWIKKIENMK